jgi:hypothetical protein
VSNDVGTPADAWRRPDPDSPHAEAAQRPEPAAPAPRRLGDDGRPNPWRRPEPSGEPPVGPPAVPPPAAPPYGGPPRSQPPPHGWRPPYVIRAGDPRELPAQDAAGLDRAERGARTLTLGIGMIAGAVTLIVTCLLCSRLLF